MKVREKTLPLALLSSALTLLPLGLFTAYLAYLALGEGRHLRTAPEMHSIHESPATAAPRLNGTFYKVMGPVTGNLLNPPEYPEVRNAFWYRVTLERRVGLDTSWVRDNSGILVSDQVKDVLVGNLPVEISPMARLALPVAEAYREVDDNLRYAIESKPIPPGGAVIFGLYRGGVLSDGIFDRLLVISADHFEETITKLDRKAHVKGFFLGGISVVFLALAFVISLSAWRGHAKAHP